MGQVLETKSSRARVLNADYADGADYRRYLFGFHPHNPHHPRNPRSKLLVVMSQLY
jgi:hypothetical protein